MCPDVLIEKLHIIRYFRSHNTLCQPYLWCHNTYASYVCSVIARHACHVYDIITRHASHVCDVITRHTSVVCDVLRHHASRVYDVITPRANVVCDVLRYHASHVYDVITRRASVFCDVLRYHASHVTPQKITWYAGWNHARTAFFWTYVLIVLLPRKACCNNIHNLQDMEMVLIREPCSAFLKMSFWNCDRTNHI